MQDFIKFIVTSILTNEEQVEVKRIDPDPNDINPYEDTYEVNCAEEEKGRLIGKNGKTIMAIRDIVNASAIKNRKKKVRIKVGD